jgi:D-alanyl-D-alanine carboxypeptidase/D-alanyl-D-alanine carboxypeptidase (penicillin-binding protein 5/6)
MTALITLEQGELDEKFTVDSEAIKVEGSSMGLTEGDVVSLRDLACGMLLPSGNDAANAAAVRVAGSIEAFVDMMNRRGAEMGLKDTHFVTPSGLDDDTDEHFSTAYDMALLAAEAMKNQDFREICSQEKIKLSFGNPPYDRWLTNSNKLLSLCDGVVGVKTGFTDKARRCLVSACDRNGAELICVTLNDPDDWNDHQRLYDYSFGLVSQQQLNPPSESFCVNVVGSDKDYVRCTSESTSAVLLNGRGENVTSQVFVEPFVYAPVAVGDVVGRVVYSYNGRVMAETEITAVESAELVHREKQPFYKRILERLGR